VIQFTQILDKWTKIGMQVGIWFGNNQDNFQLHRFTMTENIAKSFPGSDGWGRLLFWLTLYIYKYRMLFYVFTFKHPRTK